MVIENKRSIVPCPPGLRAYYVNDDGTVDSDRVWALVMVERYAQDGAGGSVADFYPLTSIGGELWLDDTSVTPGNSLGTEDEEKMEHHGGPAKFFKEQIASYLNRRAAAANMLVAEALRCKEPTT